jgi:hypothetical protein
MTNFRPLYKNFKRFYKGIEWKNVGRNGKQQVVLVGNIFIDRVDKFLLYKMKFCFGEK